MTKTILSDENSRLIALMSSSEQDLGNISRCFYDEFRASDRCSYAAQYRGPRLQMSFELTEKIAIPRPCRIHAVNGGLSLPFNLPEEDAHCHKSNKYNACCSLGGERKSGPRKVYYYDFAIIGECGNVDVCLDAFFKRMGLREVESCSTMSDAELYSIMGRWQEDAISLCEPILR